MYKIEEFQAINYAQNYLITMHAKERLKERGLSLSDIISAVESGDIIEQYEDDFPMPSCLILGKDALGRAIHIVVSKDEFVIYVITAYIPCMERWSSDCKYRKRGK